jgi:formate/nitrite transporter
MVWLMYESRLWETGNVADQAIKVAIIKCKLSFWVAFVRGILCNWLVCLAVVMATAARDISGKLLACYAPIMAFVAAGFEHSIANIYYIPEGILVAGARGITDPALTWNNFLLTNLLPVTLGNILGGVLFVATAYWYVHAVILVKKDKPSLTKPV